MARSQTGAWGRRDDAAISRQRRRTRHGGNGARRAAGKDTHPGFIASVASFLTAGGGTAFGGILRRRVFHPGHGLCADRVAATAKHEPPTTNSRTQLLASIPDWFSYNKRCVALYATKRYCLLVLSGYTKNSRESAFPGSSGRQQRAKATVRYAIGDEVSPFRTAPTAPHDSESDPPPRGQTTANPRLPTARNTAHDSRS